MTIRKVAENGIFRRATTTISSKTNDYKVWQVRKKAALSTNELHVDIYVHNLIKCFRHLRTESEEII